jgi:hypothetical protein
VVRARRAFVVAWLGLSLLGALNHTIAKKLFGGHLNLMLPHLEWGHVMFAENPHHAEVLTYAGADGARHWIADLMEPPAPFYSRGRLSLNKIIKPEVLAEVCLRAERHQPRELTFFIDKYDLDVDRTKPYTVETYRCDVHGRMAH